MWIAFYIALGIILLVLLSTLVCFLLVFYSPKRKKLKEDEFEIPPGEIYEKYKEEMIGWVRDSRNFPYKEMEIKSFDGLTLRGKYYECKAGAPIELLFHGYRGNAERDLSGGVARCFALGRNALLINQRASGDSDGHIITFGIKEHKDCLAWIDFAIEYFGKDVRLILTGLSMGASTVAMASGKELPKNVESILADCGYSSPKEIIVKIIKQIHLPVFIIYPLIKLGARLFGGFNLESYSPVEAVKNSHVPLIFIHGDDDDFVPCEMSERLYELCSSKHKKLVKIEGAGHGLAFPCDREKYLEALKSFETEYSTEKAI
ncbi:MAG: alpha/beta hydrolase [Clostridia bacterium]|nr:alpha/beta hydrolase [Clostridia bacterium]